ncbi:RND family transporter [Adlercreutzia sp. ZJ242]|uniref:efflux RND transporter permease subunit n=1 Tax=Adlercreutzia sp. ZJ242 TaxID=2709409 RepID=UPI001F14A29B|nr:MMPL family transporter [Adlercreutzia sp. ZJ242]
MGYKLRMDRLISGIIAHRRAVVAAFLAVAVVCAACIPFVRTNYDMADYLPPSAQSTTAVEIMSTQFDQAIPNAYVMVRDVSVAAALAVKAGLADLPGVEDVMWLDDMVDVTVPLEVLDPSTVEAYYKDGAALFQVSVAEGEEGPGVAALRAYVDALGEGNAVSGDAADIAQMQSSVVEQVGMAVAIVVPAIVLLLVLSTLSWIEPLLFLLAIGVSILINMGTNLVLGEVSFITFSVSPILQLAVSLDYAIFLLHAFASERLRGDGVEAAMARAMRSSVSTIAASAVTTLFGFAALSFMQFQIGADLGLNLVKGIVLSFVTVVVFLPAVTLLLCKLIDKTAHRPLMPSFKGVDKVLRHVRVPALVLVLALVVPAFLGQAHATFTYSNGQPDLTLRSGADTAAVREEFGRQNVVAVLVPRGNIAAEAALSDDLAQLDHVTGVMSYASMVGAAIPQEWLGEGVTSQFYSDEYARIVASVDTEVEGDEAFATVEEIAQTTARRYDTFYTAGQSANLYDMRNVVAVDNVVVSLVAVIAIFAVLLVTFRSLALPFALLLAIESGIWINLSIPYFTGTPINFIGYLVINTVQLGATIDYGILLTMHYLRARKLMPARAAAAAALGTSFRSLLVSAGILASAGFALSFSSSISAVSTLGLLLGRGALISLALVTCFLPALLIGLDGIIRRTTFRAGFYAPSASDALVVPAGAPAAACEPAPSAAACEPAPPAASSAMSSAPSASPAPFAGASKGENHE